MQMTQQSVADPKDEPNVWTVRDVDFDVRHRLKVQAAIKRVTVGQLISTTLRNWLDAGAPDEFIAGSGSSND